MANASAMARRERAVEAYRRGDGTLVDVAATFTLDPRTLQRWVARERHTGSVAARPKAVDGGARFFCRCSTR